MSDYIRLNCYRTNELVYYKDLTGINEELRHTEFDGVSIENIGSPEIVLKNKSAKPSDFVMGLGKFNFPVVSGRFKDFLCSYSDKEYLQFFECTSNSTRKEKYYLMNILENIDCFDWENSTYNKLPYATDKNRFWADEITEIQFVEEKINGRNIFRCTEYDTNIFISKEFEEEILKQRFLVTLVRSQNMNDITDAFPDDPHRAFWGHENIQ